MNSRDQRRKALATQPECVRGYKDSVLEIPLSDTKLDLEALQKHIESIIVPEYHHLLVSVILLNREHLHDTHPAWDNPLVCDIKITTQYQQHSFTTEASIPIVWKKQEKQTPKDYYEAIIQARVHSKDTLKHIAGAIEQSRLQVSKHVKHKHGADWYVDDNHKAQSLMKRMAKQRGGTVKLSAKLHGVDHQSSKKVYRVTISYHEDE